MAKHSKGFLSRRGFLEVGSLTAGGFLLRQSLLGNTAQAAAGDPKFLLLVYFSGGWDQLLALDPRPANVAKYMPIAGKKPTSGILPAYDLSGDGDANVRAVLAATGGSGVQTRGNLSFGPAVPDALLQHSADLALVRGINMDTLTHEVGRRYLLTGKFPRGLSANGSSLTTVVAGQSNSGLDLPNLALDIEGYNEGWPASASPTKVASQNDVVNVLRQATPALLPGSDAALKAWEAAEDSCDAHGYDATGLVTAFRASRAQARTMTNSTKAQLFTFALPPSPLVAPLFSAMQISTAADLNGPKGNAAIAAQAITQGISQVVAVQLASGLDDHFDMSGEQSVTQRQGFEALGLLIQQLKATQLGTTGKSFWDFTTLMCFSEFARTPMVNAREGRDHHLTNSALLAGPGLKGNTVFGASSDVEMGAQKWNLATGALDLTAGNPIRPADLHATVLTSMGLSSAHLSNQSPKLLAPLLR